MKNSKKLFLIFLSVLIVVFISCKKDSGGSITTPTPTFKLSDITGRWTATKNTSNTLTINNGTITTVINSTSITFSIKDWDNKKNEEVTIYTDTKEQTTSPSYKATLTFKSASSCDVTVTFGDKPTAPVNETFKKDTTRK